MLEKVKFCKLDPRAITPTRKNSTDAGLDLRSLNDVIIKPHKSALVQTGISLEIPEGYMVKLWAKGKATFLVGAGVVDSYYQPGEIIVRIFNTYDENLVIDRGTPICQAVYLPVETPEIEEVSEEELENGSSRSKVGGILNGTSEIEFTPYWGELGTGC